MENLSAIKAILHRLCAVLPKKIVKELIKMKKAIATCSALLLICVGFTGCGSRDDDSSSMAESSVSATEESRRDESSEKYESNGSNNSDRHDNTAGDYVSDVIDGVESAGEDIVDGVGDAAGDIADGLDGESRETTTANNR